MLTYMHVDVHSYSCGLYLISYQPFALFKDLPKLNRCTELLSMNEELKQARKAFEVDEEKLATIE